MFYIQKVKDSILGTEQIFERFGTKISVEDPLLVELDSNCLDHR